jgi:hypothetical protein
MKRAHYLLLLIFFAAAFGLTSCRQNSISGSQDCTNYNYSDCNTTEPFLVGLNIKLTINDENPRVPITIYEGDAEEQLIVRIDTITTTDFNVLLPVNKYYSVKVRYRKNGQTIYAFGGAKTKKTGSTICDSTCWTTTEGYVNVELKN